MSGGCLGQSVAMPQFHFQAVSGRSALLCPRAVADLRQDLFGQPDGLGGVIAVDARGPAQPDAADKVFQLVPQRIGRRQRKLRRGQDRVEDMQMFRLPFGPVVHNEFIVDRDRIAVGPLFFESPTGAWEKGTYALVVRHKDGTAELPITLE